jgi:membrane protein implicated in regulation of membrane protease activity
MNLIIWLRILFFVLLVALPLYRWRRALRLRRAAQARRGRDGRLIVDESRVVDSTLVEPDDSGRRQGQG